MPTASVGFIFPGTGQNGPNNPDSATGGTANLNWAGPTNIEAAANSATFSRTVGSEIDTAKYLQGRAYDFSSLPDNKPVLGIELRFDYSLSITPDVDGTVTVTINHVSIIRADALAGTDTDPSISLGGTTSDSVAQTTKTMGGSADLWGLGSLNTEDISGDTGFGFGVAGKITGTDLGNEPGGSGGDGTINIHSHEMKIYYEDKGQVKVWTGAAFEVKDVKYYDGANFELTSKVKYWNGSAFVATLD